MRRQKMPTPLGQAGENVQALKGLIGWFNQSSFELIQEYRRLEDRAATLKGQLEAKHRELESSLREREEARAYLLSVLESLKAGVLVLDKNLRPTFVNRRLTELTGAVDNERVVQLLGDNLAASLLRGDKEFLPLECEKVVQGPGGVMTPAHFILSEVVTGQERSDYVLVFQDITTLKRLEAETARTRRLASLGVMASEIAHQVSSPLGGRNFERRAASVYDALTSPLFCCGAQHRRRCFIRCVAVGRSAGRLPTAIRQQPVVDQLFMRIGSPAPMG
jgi:PAS domain-containing protein